MELDISLDKDETGKLIRDTKIFFFELDPPESTPLSVVTIGWELTGENYDLRRKHYPFHTIEFIDHGHGTFTLNGKDFPLEPRCILAYRPHQDYTISAATDSRLSKFWISMAGTEVKQFFEHISAVESPVIPMRDSRYMHELFLQMLDYAARYNFDIGHETCKLVLKLIMKRIFNDSETTHHKQATSYTRFTECVDYMETREAAEILLYTDKTVRQVADELGFEDQFIFSKCFKRVYGVSPKHFRDNFDRTK